MDGVDERLVASLKRAAEDLGVRVVVPHDVKLRTGTAVRVEGYFPDFGTPQGIAVISFSRRVKLGGLTEPMSILTAEYRKYSRKLFAAALNDWGWYGDDPPPDWFDDR